MENSAVPWEAGKVVNSLRGSVFGSKFCWTRWTTGEVVNSLQQ